MTKYPTKHSRECLPISLALEILVAHARIYNLEIFSFESSSHFDYSSSTFLWGG